MARDVNNVEDLRNFLVDQMEAAHRGKIDIEKLGILSKAGEGILGTIKVQLAYGAMRGEKANIPFLQSCHKSDGKIIEGKVHNKMIEGKKK